MAHEWRRRRRTGLPGSPGRDARAPRSFRPSVEAAEDRCTPSHIPVLVVPGEVGSFPVGVNSPDPKVVAGAFQEFADHLGLPPTELTAQIQNKGVESGYTSLIDSLEKAGYRLGVDLFVVAQDWRLPIAPLDGKNDGHLSNLTASVMTDGRAYRYSTQYLGYWLQQADRAWERTHGGQEVPYVDVIAHSEGYAITRAYISSAAYGAAYVNAQGQVDHLPRIGTFIDLAGPNQGVATMYNDLNNNFYQPNAFGFTQLRYEVFQLAYDEVAQFGRSIEGPAGRPWVTPRSITDPRTHQPDPVRFLHQYFRAGLGLTATYPALDGHAVTRPGFRNNLFLDLNARGVGTFAGDIGHMTALFGADQPTTTALVTRVGPGGLVQSLSASAAGFETKPHPTVPGQVWYGGIVTAHGGDGQAPIESLVSTLPGNPRVTLDPLSGINHITVLTDPSVQAEILAILQDPVPPPPRR